MEQFTNNAQTTLAAAVTTTDGTSISVTNASGFPTTGNFRILVDDEIMVVTGVSGTTFTVTRGAESTTGATHSSGAAVTHVLTAGAVTAIRGMELIAETEVGSGGAASIDFTSIPATYSSLMLVAHWRSNVSGDNDYVDLLCNGDTGNNYDDVYASILRTGLGYGEDAPRGFAVAGFCPGGTSDAGLFGQATVLIADYAHTNKNKVIYAEWQAKYSNTAGSTNFRFGWYHNSWRSNSAINQLTVSPGSGNFAQYSSVRLYGII